MYITNRVPYNTYPSFVHHDRTTYLSASLPPTPWNSLAVAAAARKDFESFPRVLANI